MNAIDALLTREQIAAFCERWRIREFAVFGSALRDDFGPDSDLDVLVTYAPDAQWSLLDHVAMEEELSEVVGRSVDIVTRRAVERSENWIRREAMLGSAQVVYRGG
ncbi:nucleotidyltransferase [Candidatus Poribacteria bacterium]|nr:nucleotidyltransferase [Candidatus Poribacteria bacterium]